MPEIQTSLLPQTGGREAGRHRSGMQALWMIFNCPALIKVPCFALVLVQCQPHRQRGQSTQRSLRFFLLSKDVVNVVWTCRLAWLKSLQSLVRYAFSATPLAPNSNCLPQQLV